MRRALLVVFVTACGSQARPASEAPVPARVAMDSAQIDRTCAQAGFVRVGLLECELKDQAPVLPADLTRLPP